jgi:hypothetical protein
VRHLVLQGPEAGRLRARAHVSTTTTSTTPDGGGRHLSYQESQSTGTGSSGGANDEAVRRRTTRGCRWVGSIAVLHITHPGVEAFPSHKLCMQLLFLLCPKLHLHSEPRSWTQEVSLCTVSSLCYLFIYLFIHSFTHSFIYVFICLCINLYIYLGFIYHLVFLS